MPGCDLEKEGASTQLCRLSHAGGLPVERGTGYCSGDPQQDGTLVSVAAAAWLSSARGAQSPAPSLTLL